MLSGTVEQIPDVDADADYAVGAAQRRLRSVAPWRRPCCGTVSPSEPYPSPEPSRDTFLTQQIELLQTFADQAVIAIENVRLFEEVQARTAELSEALQQQTATADVLEVISRSLIDIAARARCALCRVGRAALCEARQCNIVLRDGDEFRHAAVAEFGL